MRSQRLLRVVLPVAVLGLLGLGVGTLAFKGGAPEAGEPAPPAIEGTAGLEEQEPEAEPKKAKKRTKTPLERKLKQHRVVVVLLYAPDSAVDSLATREARAGALAAGAGFLAVNVVKDKSVARLATRLGVRDAPGLLVFRRGLRLATRIAGFADRETVAQAAENALL